MQSLKQHVLLVDDEPQILTALEDLLADDYTIVKTQTAQRALDLVREDQNIAVVITDQRMPQMNGDEFLSKIGDQSQAVRIMVSGFADLPAVLRAVNEGKVYAYVTKPWNEDDLLHKVQVAAEHFRLAQQLEHERRLLRDLMDNSPDGIYFKDAELRFLRANGSFARAMGRSTTDELVGHRLSDLLGQSPELSADQEERRVLDQGKPILDVVRQHQRGGRRYFLSETKAPIRGANGVAVGLVGISRDVTERVETSEALRESEAALQQQTGILNSILDGMGEGVVGIARDGRTLLCNKEASRILGMSVRDVAVEDWPATYGLRLPDGKAQLPPEANPLRRAMLGEPLVRVDARISNLVVANTLVAITATPLRDPEGGIAGAIALLQDVTERRGLEQQLAQSQKMEAIGQLAGGVAHDFNNLLTVIVGCAELSLQELGTDDWRRSNIAEVLSAANRATLLTQQLLAFSRQQVIQPKEIQLNEILSDFTGMLRRLIPKRITITTALRPNLSMIVADKSQIEQVLLNLAVNARDAMPESGTLHMETGEEAVSDVRATELGVPPGIYVSLWVTDTGTGMSEETRKHIFEPFFTTKEVGRGTGLGLSTVYGIVRQCGGVVQAQSVLGEGTAFHVLLPRGIRAQTTSTAPPRSTRPRNAVILLLERDRSVRTVATRILRSRGHAVIESEEITDARVILFDPKLHVELLLLEVAQLTEAFWQELATSRPSLRLVLMTGSSPVGRDMKIPVADVTLLSKPFSRASLLETVDAALASEPAEQRS